jgi:hypothetical protein
VCGVGGRITGTGRAVTELVNLRETNRRDSKEEKAKNVTEKSSIKEIDAKAREFVAVARKMGWKTAADNLEYYLDGKSLPKTISRRWLRSFKKVRTAERNIRGYCQQFIIDKIGEHIYLYPESNRVAYMAFTDYFESKINYGGTGYSSEELFFASGNSVVRAYCPFKITIKGNNVTVTGNVEYHWWDDYDFHNGLAVYIPGYGIIPDAAMKKLLKGKAREYRMESDWRQSLNASFKLGARNEQINWHWGVSF